jgi:hypothetical protein
MGDKQMGMYTEIYVNADLKENTPKEVLAVLSAICEQEIGAAVLEGYPRRWLTLFSNGSRYAPSTWAASLTFNDYMGQWYLLGRGDIKNYEGEIEAFFKFIKPWCDDGLVGYYRYEEDREPTLVYTDE